jgi:hypothetical protein
MAELLNQTIDLFVENAAGSGKVELEFCDRLDNWQKLADLLEIQSSEQARWVQGYEARGILEWLKKRNRLGDLPDALREINRSDLADLINIHPT